MYCVKPIDFFKFSNICKFQQFGRKVNLLKFNFLESKNVFVKKISFDS